MNANIVVKLSMFSTILASRAIVAQLASKPRIAQENAVAGALQ